ncbi:HAD family hydrolase [Streptomyces sp. NPDC053560]|uniref:HAD family hydrolase n=1 Tax=Streptomyces sp. NPDC053560 TaxID=3365711 RepID=UPI0037D6BAD1
MATHTLTVGFDLDMTLIDSRPGIKDAYAALSAATDTYIDTDLVTSRLGPPLEQEIRNWYPEERVAEIADRYRALYPEHAITGTLAMEGAREAVEAVQSIGAGAERLPAKGGGGRRVGGRAIVVTAKYEPNAKLHLKHLGINADAVIGSLWAEGKAEALREYGASVYVGDHTGDVRGARAAGALSVAVATGPCSEEELREAGADVVLPGLAAFPAWLEGYLADASRA